MTTVEFITHLLCRVDDKLAHHEKNQKHSQSSIFLSRSPEPVLSGIRSS